MLLFGCRPSLHHLYTGAGTLYHMGSSVSAASLLLAATVFSFERFRSTFCWLRIATALGETSFRLLT
jgi:hypothetical protein